MSLVTWLTLDELVLRLKERVGIRLGPKPLKPLAPLVREGLISTRRIGLGRGRGTETRYASTSVAQLQRIERLKKQGVPVAHMQLHLLEMASKGGLSRSPTRREIVADVLSAALRRMKGQKPPLTTRLSHHGGIDDGRRELTVWNAVSDLAEVAMARLAVGSVLEGDLAALVDAEIEKRLGGAFDEVRRASMLVKMPRKRRTKGVEAHNSRRSAARQ